jgi:formylglycine-generating enzyme required for sulfatase activity
MVRIAAIACAVLWAGLLRAGDEKAGEAITNSVGMKLALIPASEFDMGSPADQKGHEHDEALHRVTISKAFRIGVTEVTQAQWKAVMGQERGSVKGENLPVHEVSWKDANDFCEKLSKSEGKKYRLPTEAEWEYACRAGQTGRFAGSENAGDVAWNDDTSDGQPHPVAQKKPNAWGLYDMHGNVAEWCSDLYAAKYPAEAVTDPAGAKEGTARVLRGGSFSSFERGCRSASRASASPAHQLKTAGFRVVMEIAP